MSILGDKVGKSGDLTGACSPITFPMTVGLGGSMADTLNALLPYPQQAVENAFTLEACQLAQATSAFDGRRLSSPYRFVGPCFHVRGHDRHRALVITYLCWSVESEPRFVCEPSSYECWLGYPLLTSSTVAPDPLFEHLCSSRGSSDGQVSMGVARVTTAGVAPEPLEES